MLGVWILDSGIWTETKTVIDIYVRAWVNERWWWLRSCVDELTMGDGLEGRSGVMW